MCPKQTTMKTLHYILIARHLTGDSEVLFFPTAEKAADHYDGLVKPITTLCVSEHLDEDVFYKCNTDSKGVIVGWRFNSGENDALDELLSDDCNHYYELGQVEVDDDVTHYVVQFSEWVDDTDIRFYNERQALQSLTELVNEGIQMCEDYEGHKIDRADCSTWNNSEGMTLFSETSNTHLIDVYFGYGDTTSTVRFGNIHFYLDEPTREGLYADMFVEPKI